MTRALAIFLLPLFLAACGGGSNPFAPDDGGTTGGGTGGGGSDPDSGTGLVPAELAGDIDSVSYDPDSGTLTINGLTLDDATTDGIEYRRRPGLDIRNAGGDVVFQAYTVQDDPLDRHVTAYARESLNGGDVRAVVGHSGGVRNRFFSGAFFERDGDYDPADIPGTVGSPEGNVRYTGDYVGLTNLPGSTEDLAAVPGTVDSSLRSTQAAEITGEVVMVADFNDGAIEGNILNRQLADSGVALPKIVLVNTGIAENGTFSGSAEYDGAEYADVVGSSIGTYGGIIGGTEAGSIAGAVKLDGFDGPDDDVLGLENETEHGIFVLDRCGQGVDDPLCAAVSP